MDESQADDEQANAAPALAARGEGYQVWLGRRGEMRLSHDVAGAVCIAVEGHGDGGYAAPILEACTRVLRASTRLVMLFDWAQVPSYDSGLRLELTSWTVQHRTQVEVIHLFTKMPVVRMGAAVANLVVGGLIRVHDRRATFGAELAKYKLPRPPSMSERPGSGSSGPAS